MFLLVTIIKGSIGMGAQRWINVGFTKFQPSELTKLFFPAFVTYYLCTEKQDRRATQILKLRAGHPGTRLQFFLLKYSLTLGPLLLCSFQARSFSGLLASAENFLFLSFLALCLAAPVFYASLKTLSTDSYHGIFWRRR